MMRSVALRLVLATTALTLVSRGDALGAKEDEGNSVDAKVNATGIEFFEKHIRPVLVTRCYKCHSQQANKKEGGLYLDSRSAMIQGGESGPAVVAGKPKESLLLDAIRYENFEMPPDSKLDSRVVSLFEEWIQMGAPDPRVTKQDTDDGDVASDGGIKENGIDFAKAQEFWSLKKPELPPLPQVKRSAWPKNRLDYFTLAKMEANSLSPTAGAETAQLIRRMFYDVIGLPPTPAEMQMWQDRFAQEDSDATIASLQNFLVNSPHFGERWARVWLDVARYAEDQAHIVGNNKSLFYPNAYLYRDWLIDAYNSDIPFDEFITLQLSADLQSRDSEGKPPADGESDFLKHKAALGFIGLGPKYYRRNDPEVMADEWEDRVDTVTRGLLGLTVACARCHDHKFDPIETEDYYALAGVFASTKMVNAAMPGQKPDGKDGTVKSPDKAMHIVAESKPKDIKVHIRGNVKTQGDVVPRRFLKVLSQDANPKSFATGSGRGDLAKSIVSPENPLTARVYVNRIWGQLIGSYLVATPSNFGQLGERPTHPQLLDDLAVRFMANGWSTKWLVREIVSSATYQQSANGSKESLQADPGNVWLARSNRRRLSIESWRDGVLSVSGELEPTIGGKSIDVADPKIGRRSVYSKVSRFQLDSMLAMFDFPDPNTHAAKRNETTTALQKLFALNSKFITSHAEKFAARLASEYQEDLGEQVKLAFLLTCGRIPDAEEQSWATEFISSGDPKQQNARRIQFAQVMLISNEMMYVD